MRHLKSFAFLTILIVFVSSTTCCSTKTADEWAADAAIYLMRGQPGESIRCCNNALKVDPNHANAYGIRGMAYYSAGKYNKALADLNRACDMGDTSSCESYEEIRRQLNR